jgi:uncharacterized protein (DUF111 family)
VAALVDDFGPLPAMRVNQIGYGAGQKDFPQANILRLLVGESATGEPASAGGTIAPAPHTESIILLETNLDNATGETIGHAVDSLWSAGALDVTLTPTQMKKGRPGMVLSVQARPADADKLEALLFTRTPTLGVRRTTVLRTVLARTPRTVETKWGPIDGKVIYLPDETERFAPEYESCRQIAERYNIPLAVVNAAALAAFNAPGPEDRAI